MDCIYFSFCLPSVFHSICCIMKSIKNVMGRIVVLCCRSDHILVAALIFLDNFVSINVWCLFNFMFICLNENQGSLSRAFH